jgi:hypothetical protein
MTWEVLYNATSNVVIFWYPRSQYQKQKTSRGASPREMSFDVIFILRRRRFVFLWTPMCLILEETKKIDNFARSVSLQQTFFFVFTIFYPTRVLGRRCAMDTQLDIYVYLHIYISIRGSSALSIISSRYYAKETRCSCVLYRVQLGQSICA